MGHRAIFTDGTKGVTYLTLTPDIWFQAGGISAALLKTTRSSWLLFAQIPHTSPEYDQSVLHVVGWEVDAQSYLAYVIYRSYVSALRWCVLRSQTHVTYIGAE